MIHNQSMALRKRTLLKVLVLGDSRVGKTAVINQYVHKKFEKEYKGTIGADFFTKELKIGDQPVTLQIWDTAGRERFQSRGVSFYRGSDCCVLIYDINHMKSFDALKNWHAEFVEKGTPDDSTTPPIILLGNKVDVDGGSSRVVSDEKARAWCASRGNIPYFETSAKMDFNLDAAFLSIAMSVLAKERDDVYSQPFPEPAAPVNIQRVGCASSWCAFLSNALAKILRILSRRRT